MWVRGDEFLAAVDAELVDIRAQPERRSREHDGMFSFRTEHFPFRVVSEPHLALSSGLEHGVDTYRRLFVNA